MNYLGHVTHPGPLAVSQYTIYTTRNLTPPTNITELRWFLGFEASFGVLYPTLCALRHLLTENCGMSNRQI